MNNQEVCHLWANQSRESAKGSNLFFEGATLYSYGRHFPIATIHNGVVLWNPGKYSISTSKHQSYARRAIHQRTMSVNPKRWDAIRAGTLSIDDAVQMQAQDDAANAEAQKQARRDDAKRKRDNARVEKLALEEYPQKLAEWRNGGPLPPLANRFSTTLRLIEREGRKLVETSARATVPACVCRKVWPILKAEVDKEIASPCGVAWTPFFSAPDFNWGDYRGIALRKIALGSPVELVVGCHKIPFTELEYIAKELGLTS